MTESLMSYRSPVGILSIRSEGRFVREIRHENATSPCVRQDEASSSPVLLRARTWLDRYFAGECPSSRDLLFLPRGTAFQCAVWKIVSDIPYGHVVSYGEIAHRFAVKTGRKHFPAQAIGGAVARNPLLIVIPCHRVVGANGALTGYSGGLAMKKALLLHEGAACLTVPGNLKKRIVVDYPDHKPRCSWVNPKNPLCIRYHDKVWGVPVRDDHTLFKMLVLESFQIGLSWECVLNKEANLSRAFDDFDLDCVCTYGEKKIAGLLADPGIIRHEGKIRAAIANARVFKAIQKEFGTFADYLWGWTDNQVIHEKGLARSGLSDSLAGDLKKRGMKFVGSTMAYAYLQAVGVVNSHEEGCFLAD